MSHLTPAEIVDAVDGALAPDRLAHARECAPCHGEIQRAGVTLGRVRAVDAPEPSPLFWDHFSARVRDAIAAERPQRGQARWGPRVWAPLGAAAALALGIGLARTPVAPPPVEPSHVESTQHAAPRHVESHADDPWLVVSDLAGDMEWSEAEAAGFSLRPGAAEHALLQLSDDQQQELVRLLETEIDRLRSRG